MSQVTIRRPFRELDLGDQLRFSAEHGRRQPGLSFDRWRNQFNPSVCFPGIIESLCPPAPTRLAESSGDLLSCFQIDEQLELRRCSQTVFLDHCY